MTVRRRVARRFERALLGTVMNVIAFIIERRVLRAIRGTGRKPVPRGQVRPARPGPASLGLAFRR